MVRETTTAPDQDRHATESSEVLRSAVEEFTRAAAGRLDGVLVDAQVEGLSVEESVCRLLLLSSIDIRKVARDADYGRAIPDDHN